MWYVCQTVQKLKSQSNECLKRAVCQTGALNSEESSYSIQSIVIFRVVVMARLSHSRHKIPWHHGVILQHRPIRSRRLWMQAEEDPPAGPSRSRWLRRLGAESNRFSFFLPQSISLSRSLFSLVYYSVRFNFFFLNIWAWYCYSNAICVTQVLH